MNLNKENLYALGTPVIEVVQGNIKIATIDTLRNYDDSNNIITLEFDNMIPRIKRGLLCDFIVKWTDRNSENKIESDREEFIKDLLLVEVKVSSQWDELTRREYVFYKD